MQNYSDINEYINKQPEERRAALSMLRKCILSAAPDAEELFNYGIPAFALVKNGKREQQIMMAGYKKPVGFYPHPTTIEKFKKELKTYKQGKGSVQFPITERLPEELIIEMVKYRKKLILEQE